LALLGNNNRHCSLVSAFYIEYRGFTRGVEGVYWGISGGYSDGLDLSAGSSAIAKNLHGQFMKAVFRGEDGLVPEIGAVNMGNASGTRPQGLGQAA
jgi:hypothetical protein